MVSLGFCLWSETQAFSGAQLVLFPVPFPAHPPVPGRSLFPVTSYGRPASRFWPSRPSFPYFLPGFYSLRNGGMPTFPTSLSVRGGLVTPFWPTRQEGASTWGAPEDDFSSLVKGGLPVATLVTPAACLWMLCGMKL